MKRSQFRRLMDILLRTLGRQTRRTIQQYGVPVTDAQRVEVAQALLPHIQRARLQSHALGVQLLEAQADGMGLPVPEVAPVRPYERQAVVTVLENVTRVERPRREGPSVTVTDDNEIPDDAPRVSVTVLDPVTRRDSRVTVEVTEDNRRDPEVVKVVTEKAVAVVERHARMPSREAVTDAADAVDEYRGAKIGWARILTGAESCGFCSMLASRGPVYRSEQTASRIGGSQKAFHDRCDCECVLVREDEDWVGQEAFEELEKLWIAATLTTSGKASLKAFTAALNQEIANGDAGRFVPNID